MSETTREEAEGVRIRQWGDIQFGDAGRPEGTAWSRPPGRQNTDSPPVHPPGDEADRGNARLVHRVQIIDHE
ncbi:hypothetical protein [Gordonia rubripertincta]|uniref:hypothetical protein n=1 Tax=Gordonia rubripertincta TaxID=36822 RepID=UPI0020C42846|nr:hypothetical protein [Gordonia rubripertincta]